MGRKKIKRNLIIRPARKKDLAQICKIAHQVNRSIKIHRSSLFGALREFYANSGIYFRALRNPRKNIFVIEGKTAEVIGYAYVTFQKKPADLIDIPYVRVEEIAIKRGFRSLGLGKILMQKVEEWAALIRNQCYPAGRVGI